MASLTPLPYNKVIKLSKFWSKTLGDHIVIKTLKELVHDLYVEKIKVEGKKEGREGRKERSKTNLASSQKG